jgi:hypothetical protein
MTLNHIMTHLCGIQFFLQYIFKGLTLQSIYLKIYLQTLFLQLDYHLLVNFQSTLFPVKEAIRINNMGKTNIMIRNQTTPMHYHL